MMNGFAKMASVAILAREFTDGFDNLPHYDPFNDHSMENCNFEWLQAEGVTQMYTTINSYLGEVKTYQQCIDIYKIAVPYIDLNDDMVVDSCEATLWALGSGNNISEPRSGFDWYDVVDWCANSFPQ